MCGFMQKKLKMHRARADSVQASLKLPVKEARRSKMAGGAAFLPRQAPMGQGNCTTCWGAWGLFGSYELWVLFSATGILFLLSLTGNIFCCLRRHKKEKNRNLFHHFGRRFSFKNIEENPVYGNLSFLQSAGQQLGEKKILDTESSEQWKSQTQGNLGKPICYANVNPRKPVRSQGVDSGIQYTDVVTVVKRKSDAEIWGDAFDTHREPKVTHRQETKLYASVQLQQYKPLFENQDYANKQPTDV
ncbi:signaling threshold-regulating transmembrane adapter 1 [Rhinatrema bivittatum]|uniref:signaling threshold-regulating transmembrane adapter 1 n=1 Tax=Rhinatrema bivittatum TaxID=194408 RepID=UPI0011294D8D|nr:signaling threshold-regulating transmembrane adapter 1 [Rhinatrema bivittatum]